MKKKGRGRIDEEGREQQKERKMLASRTVYVTTTTFMEGLLELSEFIDKSRADPISTKADVLDSMETRLSFLVGKMAVSPTCMPFRVFSEAAKTT